ncbi:cation diffusion facilitator family transporter [Candidatus Parcubacteria bacterium]|nr:MAG: cation diffusion facilitator family transporter [Candidatus Parcubacteria bacterium]
MALQSTQGFWPVAAAIGGNFFVMVIKFFAAVSSGSSSMLSEAVHSLADTVNQILLLIGLGRSIKKADESFEYGYGNERFFWALISACGVLFVGAGVTLYNGISALTKPHEVEFSALVFGVLLVSFVIESYTFFVAARALKKDFPRANWSERLSRADPSTLSVYLEDAVAVLGIVVASASITLSYYTGNAIWDAVGSVLIAILLGAIAITLIVKNRSYLIGRAMPEELQEEVIELLRVEPAIEKVIDFKSVTVGFGVYRIKCEVEFNGSALLREAYRDKALRAEYEEVHGDFEAFKRFCADYADRIPRLIGKKIDDIEAHIKKLHAGIRHIDIEIN